MVVSMRAVIEDAVIAESDDIVEQGGYAYFPGTGVRLDWLERRRRHRTSPARMAFNSTTW